MDDAQKAAAAKAAEADSKVAEQVEGIFKNFFSNELPELVKNEIAEQMKSLAAAQVNNPPTPTKADDFDAMENWQKAAKFYGDVYKKDVSFWVEKGLTEGVDSEGGYMVPEAIWTDVARIAENYGLIRSLSKRIIMTSDTFNVPTVESSVTTYWVDEEAAITESNPVFGNRKLRAQTQAGISTASNQLLADANQSIVNHLNELFAEALAGGEDEQGLNGVGTPFTGILNDTDVVTVTMPSTKTAFTDITYGDLLDLQANLKDSVVSRGVYVMHRTVWNLVLKIQENSQTAYAFQNQSMPMVKPGVRDAGITPVGVLHGKMVYVSDKMPDSGDSAVSTKFIIFGNFEAGMGFGDRQRMTIATSDSATVGGSSMFEKNQQAIRVTERVAIQIILPTAFSVLKTAAS